MGKKLPKVFQNEINKKINNNSSYFVGNEIKQNIIYNTNNTNEINKKINDIFKSINYIYKVDVIITLKTGEVTKRIIGKNKDNLITIDNELIKIDDILDIKLKRV